MNILDENIPDSQWRKLQELRFIAKKIGKDIARKGKSDEDIPRTGRIDTFLRATGFIPVV